MSKTTNFNLIKKEMEEAKLRALSQKPKEEKNTIQNQDEQSETFIINLSPKKKKTKKVYNLYLTTDLIERINKGAKQFSGGNCSAFIEELLNQIFDSLNI